MRARNSQSKFYTFQGYNANEAKVQELRDELSFYNDEMAVMGQQLDESVKLLFGNILIEL